MPRQLPACSVGPPKFGQRIKERLSTFSACWTEARRRNLVLETPGPSVGSFTAVVM